MSANTLNRESREWMLKSDVEAGAEVLADAKRVLVRAVEEVERFQRQYAGAPSTIGTCKSAEAQTLSSAANFLTTYLLGNMRLDLFVTYAAKIEAARAVLAREVE